MIERHGPCPTWREECRGEWPRKANDLERLAAWLKYGTRRALRNLRRLDRLYAKAGRIAQHLARIAESLDAEALPPPPEGRPT